MSLQYLRDAISLAQENEKQDPQLLALLKKRSLSLHHSLLLNSQQHSPEVLLCEFVLAYIQQVPGMLESAGKNLKNTTLGLVLNPLLKQAEDFFVQYQACQNQPKLLDLLDKAYLAHRLIEEVNEIYIKHVGKPLLPLSTTLANVVAHHVIGEQQANQFDALVLSIIASAKQTNTLALLPVRHPSNRLQQPKLLRAWISWPCLSSQLGIQLAYENEGQTQQTALPM